MAVRTLRLSALPLCSEVAARSVAQAAAILRAGGTVAFCTETVYGLGANALDASAVAKIFAAKGRPSWDPLIVHVADAGMLDSLVVSVPRAARTLMERFWPGPLTLLLPRSTLVPDAVTAGRPLVGVRMPAHPTAQVLLRAANLPIAAPSANLFGHVSPTTAEHVLADLDGRIDAVLDAGPALHGVESTVVDAAEGIVYRPGAVTLEQLQQTLPQARLFQSLPAHLEAAPQALPSPGVGIRHYAPRAELRLIGHGPGQAEELLVAARRSFRAGVLLPCGLLSAEQERNLPPGLKRFAWGHWDQPEELGRLLYAGLRALDDQGAEQILCPLPPEGGLGAAVCDRLRKAAANSN